MPREMTMNFWKQLAILKYEELWGAENLSRIAKHNQQIREGLQAADTKIKTTDWVEVTCKCGAKFKTVLKIYVCPECGAANHVPQATPDAQNRILRDGESLTVRDVEVRVREALGFKTQATEKLCSHGKIEDFHPWCFS